MFYTPLMTQKTTPEQKAKRTVTPWHDRFGTLFKLFNMRAVNVSTGFDGAKEMPRGDIRLILDEDEVWTDEQRQYLPDGVREGAAHNKLIEFKYTESFNEDALEQTLGYNIIYRRSYKLSREKVNSYLLVSMTPSDETLQRFGYKLTQFPGVYQSNFEIIKLVTVIVLNDLSDAPHNAYVKLFASKKEVKRKAITQLKEMGVFVASTDLSEYLYALAKLLFQEEKMDLRQEDHLDAELLADIGREMAIAHMNKLSTEEKGATLSKEELFGLVPAEEFLATLTPEQRMAGLPPEEFLAALPPEQRMAGLPPEKLLATLPPEERMAGLPPKERIAGLPPEEVLAALLPEQVIESLGDKELKRLSKQILSGLQIPHAEQLDVSVDSDDTD